MKEIKLSLRQIYQDVRYIQTESKFSSIRQQAYNELVTNSNSYNFYMALLESGLFVVICLAQLYYLKNILEHKRMI